MKDLASKLLVLVFENSIVIHNLKNYFLIKKTFLVLHSIFCLQFEKYKFNIKLSETEEILPIKKKRVRLSFDENSGFKVAFSSNN